MPNADYHGQADGVAVQSTRSCLACGSKAPGVGFGPAAGLVYEVFDEVILETPVLEDGSPAIEYCEQERTAIGGIKDSGKSADTVIGGYQGSCLGDNRAAVCAGVETKPCRPLIHSRDR